MAYNHDNKRLTPEDLDKPFAWPNATIGEENARGNGFVNEYHGGSLDDGEYDLSDLDKPFAWPNATIGEENARENGFVNEHHGGSRGRGRR